MGNYWSKLVYDSKVNFLEDFWISLSSVQITHVNIFSTHHGRTTNHGEFSMTIINTFFRSKIFWHLKIYFLHHIYSLKICLTFVSSSRSLTRVQISKVWKNKELDIEMRSLFWLDSLHRWFFHYNYIKCFTIRSRICLSISLIEIPSCFLVVFIYEQARSLFYLSP